MKYFILSDIHSFYDPMRSVLTKYGFEDDNPNHSVIVCGDLFDRGPDAKKVLDFVKNLTSQNRFVYVRGNHEDLLFQCLREVGMRHGISSQHFSNGTADTIMQLAGASRFDIIDGSLTSDQWSKIDEVCGFINECSRDYFEVGSYVFVHGWIPAANNWREGDWDLSRWKNGMEEWHRGRRLEGTTIVCGHWHCSWGHSHLRQDRKEFPPKNRVNWERSFEPFVDDGIIAIDACTAYTGFCNCLVIDI